jgi:hypothetical protein
MQDEKATFLERCSDEERPAFEAVIDALDALVLKPADAVGGDSPHLRWVLEKVSLLLQLRLSNTNEKDASIPLLYIWPSTKQSRKELPDSLSVSIKQLEKLPQAAVQKFDQDLEQAGFVRKKTEGWRTSTFQKVEKGRLTRILLWKGSGGRSMSPTS